MGDTYHENFPSDDDNRFQNPEIHSNFLHPNEIHRKENYILDENIFDSNQFSLPNKNPEIFDNEDIPDVFGSEKNLDLFFSFLKSDSNSPQITSTELPSSNQIINTYKLHNCLPENDARESLNRNFSFDQVFSFGKVRHPSFPIDNNKFEPPIFDSNCAKLGLSGNIYRGWKSPQPNTQVYSSQYHENFDKNVSSSINFNHNSCLFEQPIISDLWKNCNFTESAHDNG